MRRASLLGFLAVAIAPAYAMPIGGAYDLGRGDRIVVAEGNWIEREVLDDGFRARVEERTAVTTFLFGATDRLTIALSGGAKAIEVGGSGRLPLRRRLGEEWSPYARGGVQYVAYRAPEGSYWEGTSLFLDARGDVASGFSNELEWTEWQIGLLARKDHAHDLRLTAGAYWSDFRLRGTLAGSRASIRERTHLTGVAAVAGPLRWGLMGTLEGRFGAEKGVGVFLWRGF